MTGTFVLTLMIFVLLVVLAAAVIYLTWKWMRREAQHPPRRRYNESALQLLAERYARGEIDSEEYRERYRHLGGG